MVKSMTGFGRSVKESDRWNITCEIKSVNNRFLDTVVKMPKAFISLEDMVKKQVSSCLSRGHVEIFVTVEEVGEADNKVIADTALALEYCRALKEVASALKVSYEPEVRHIASQYGVMTLQKEDADLEAFGEQLKAAVTEALAELIKMRSLEGEGLAADLLCRVDKVEALRNDIAERAPKVVEDYRSKLKARMEEILGDVEVDEDKLLNEVAFFADKADIAEEVTRLVSHFGQFRDNLKSDSAVGRKLDFILQEMNREINTIGSKANDGEITSLVIEAKGELEKIREQVQNIE